MCDYNYNYDNICYFFLYLYFNLCLKIVLIFLYSGVSNMLLFCIGFFKEFFSFRIIVKERRRLYF